MKALAVCVAGLLSLVPAAAQTGATHGDALARGLQPSRMISIGMSIDEAISLLGREPDRVEEIGAACGMLDVLEWRDENVRLIGTGGNVTSVGTLSAPAMSNSQ